MASATQVGSVAAADNKMDPHASPQPFYSIRELAVRWRCSRGSVYNVLRGEKVVDFASRGHRGHKLIPRETVRRIEQAHLKVLR